MTFDLGAWPFWLLLLLSWTASLPMILPRTDSDSEPSSTVNDCLSAEPPPAPVVPLARLLAALRKREVVEPASLVDTREEVDARAERCCDVMYGLPRPETLRGRGDIGRLSDSLSCGFVWPSRSSHMVVVVNRCRGRR